VQGISQRFDSVIRFFLYILIFWLPYSPAVVESCVVTALVTWIVKRIVGMIQEDRANLSFGRKMSNVFKPLPSPLNIPIAVFMIACTISVLRSESFDQSWHNFLTKTVEWFVVYYLVLEVFKEKKHIYIVVGIFLFTSLATAFDGIVQYHITYKDFFLGHPIEPGSRATAGFKTPPALGAYLAVVVLLASSLLFVPRMRRFFRMYVFVVLILSVWALIITYTRGAWLGTLLGLIFFFTTFGYLKNRRKAYIYVGTFAVSLVVIVAFKMTVTKSVSPGVINRPTAQWRLGIWEDSFKMIKEKPLFGHGINTYMQLFQDYRRKKDGVHPYDPTYAHNCYVQLMTETGIVGLLSFLWILIQLFRWSWQRIQNSWTSDRTTSIASVGLLSGIFAYLIHSFFDNNLYSLQLSVYIWVLIGLMVAINQLPVQASSEHIG